VREGILYLIANCLIAQGQQDELNGPMTMKDQELHHMVFDNMFVGELCSLAKIETKSKIQQMTIDCLSLCMDISPVKVKTEQLILRCLGIGEDKMKSPQYPIFAMIKERMNKDYLPMLQLDGTVEFKPQGVMSDIIAPGSPAKQSKKAPAEAVEEPQSIHF